MLPQSVPSVAQRSPSTSAADEWLYATADGCDGARCTALLGQLDAMPRSAWLEIGRRERAMAPADARALDDALASLERMLAEHRLQVTAWLVCDAVGTVAHHAGDRAAHEGRLLAAARRAAERAALAHLVRPWLRREAYRTIIAPFFFVRARVGDGA